jgi:hypothetical protein
MSGLLYKNTERIERVSIVVTLLTRVSEALG